MKASHVDKLIGQIYDEINNLKINFPYSNQEFTYCFRGEAKDYGNTKIAKDVIEQYKGIVDWLIYQHKKNLHKDDEKGL